MVNKAQALAGLVDEMESYNHPTLNPRQLEPLKGNEDPNGDPGEAEGAGKVD